MIVAELLLTGPVLTVMRDSIPIEIHAFGVKALVDWLEAKPMQDARC